MPRLQALNGDKKIFDVLNLPQKCTQNVVFQTKTSFFAHKNDNFRRKSCICQKKAVPLRRKRKRHKQMEAALRQPVTQYAGTLSEEKWNSLHTIDELDTALKRIISNHFHG